MGVSGSAPATPVVLRNKHLAHVSDPRSPSAGIPRTPIEVLSSSAGSPQPGPAESPADTSQDRDPRSPTPGISRTPIRLESSDSVVLLVKQLSEVFGAESAAREPAPPGAACPAAEPVGPSSPPAGGPEAAAVVGEEAERPQSPGGAPARPARVAGPGLLSGSKPVRRKTNNKVMATSGGTGRSPLSILQDDNSPSAPAPRQAVERSPLYFHIVPRPNGLKTGRGKRHVLGDSLGEKKEATVDLSRTLKSGSCAWSDLNKENQRCPLVEN